MVFNLKYHCVFFVLLIIVCSGCKVTDNIDNNKKHQSYKAFTNDIGDYFPIDKHWIIYSDCLRSYKITVIGDTLIGEKYYKKLSSCKKIGLSIYYGNFYYIRQEGQKVYLLANNFYNEETGRDENMNYEYLLYDFNLNIGDTLFIPKRGFNIQNYDKIVTYVDFVKLNDGRKAKRIRYNDNTFDIEYVGHNKGLFQNILSTYLGCIMGCDLLVKCVENDIIIYELENTETYFPKDISWTIKTNNLYKNLSTKDTIEIGRFYSSINNTNIRSIDGKIYAMIGKWENNGNTYERYEYLLYDFSLQKGDSIIDNVWNDKKYVYVDSVATTTLLDGRPARVIYYKDSQRQCDIEFVGNIHGITWPAEQHDNSYAPDTLISCNIGEKTIWEKNNQ